MTAPLNWKEIELHAQLLAPIIEGARIDKVLVPHRPEFSEGFLKNEWILRLSNARYLWLSLRNSQPFLALGEGAGPRPSPKATRSAFDLQLSRHLEGGKILSLEAISKERIIEIRITSPKELTEVQNFSLLLQLIPAKPEAFLITSQDSKRIILARSRVKEPIEIPWELPVRAQIIDFKVRKGIQTPTQYFESLVSSLLEDSRKQRLAQAQQALKKRVQYLTQKLRQTETTLQQAQSEPDWQNYGDLLKATLHAVPELKDGVRRVMDYTIDKEIELPCDPKLGPKEQVQKFYHLAKRKNRRLDESQERIAEFRGEIDKLEPFRKDDLSPSEISALEIVIGLRVSKDGKKIQAPPEWPGRHFISKDGLHIFCGRTKEENLDLTLKHAKGNDLWMHLKGRPGTHTIIQAPKGKSVPLETLLDAATLTLHMSGGQEWGKTEIDYTWRKYIARIPGSFEVRYSQNKTLRVEFDPDRFKRLAGK